jgi:hypothetical protein
MSNPTTPFSRCRTASSAISVDLAAVRLAVSSAACAAVGEAVKHRPHHLVEGQPALGVQLGGEPHLGVDDPVGGQVLGALPGDPAQPVGRLHHPDRVPERVQVQVEVTSVSARGEHLRQLVRVARRQAGVAGLLGQLDDRRRAQPAVKVIVQQHLGHRADLVKGRAHRRSPSHLVDDQRFNRRLIVADRQRALERL